MEIKDLDMEKDALPKETGTETESMGDAAVRLPGYQSQYTGQIQDLYQNISQRGPFQWDMNSDAMYEALKNQYVSGGQMAMMDTMGQAATLTGGYGNSYAQGAGQQAYQQYLQGLNDQIPDLYNMALQNYTAEGDRMMQQYGMLMDMDNTEYGRYMDNMEMVQAQVLEMLRAGHRPSQELIDASGLSQEYIDAMYPEKGVSSGPGLVESWYNWLARTAPPNNNNNNNNNNTDDDFPTDPTGIYREAVIAAKNGDPQLGYDQLVAAQNEGLITGDQFNQYIDMYNYAWDGKYNIWDVKYN